MPNRPVTYSCETQIVFGKKRNNAICLSNVHFKSKGKGKGSCVESRLHDNACSTDFNFPLARWVPMQPATIDPTLDLCTRNPLQLGGPRQCGIRSLPDTSTHGQHWESNPRPSDLESSAPSTGPHTHSGVNLVYGMCPG